MSKENITVGIRVRPLLPEEEQTEPECVKVENGKIQITNNHKLKQFQFGYVFDRAASQQQVFDVFALPLIQDLFRGYSSSLIAYGQNKSGKTYTLSGKDSQESKGIVPRLVDHLSNRLTADFKSNMTYALGVSYIEICDQEIIDLLSIRKNTGVQIVENHSKQMQLKNVQTKSISRIQDIETHFLLGNRKRELAYSKKYRLPQNSTSVFTLYFESLEQVDKKPVLKRSKLDIVDLMASDYINRFQPILAVNPKTKIYDLSQSCIKNVINGLVFGSNGTLVPYNDSKITKLLRNSFGGQSKSKIIFHVFPIAKCYEATLSTLRMAAAASIIQNTPTSYADPSQISILRHLQNLQGSKQELRSVQEKLKLCMKISVRDDRSLDLDEEMKEMTEQNQFVSSSLLLKKAKEKKNKEIEQLNASKLQLKRKIQNLNLLFLKIEPVKNQHQLKFVKDNYAQALLKLPKEAVTNKQSNSSNQNWSQNGELGALGKTKQKERAYRQQVVDLQREFQSERELLINSIRELEQKYKFYETVAERAMRKEEINLIKINSKYDPTKRSYQVPLFAIRDKKIRHCQRFYSPKQSISHSVSSKSISQRKFMLTQLSASKLKSQYEIGKKNKEQVLQIKQIVANEGLEHQYNPYFHRSPKKYKPKTDSQKDYIPYMSHNEYQLSRGTRKIKERGSKDLVSSRSSNSNGKLMKPISSRFKFK